VTSPTLNDASLYDAAPCGLVTTSLDGTIVQVNATFSSWSGFAVDGLIGRSFVDLLEVGSRMFFETRHFPVLRLQGEVRAVSLTLERADGSPLATLANSSLSGDTIHLAIFDATERTEFERELVRARRMSEASESRVRVLQAAAGAFGSSETEAELALALASSVRTAFAATSTAVWMTDENGALQLLAGGSPLDDIGGVVDLEVRHIESVSAARELSPALAAAMENSRTASLSVYPVAAADGRGGVVATFFSRERSMDEAYGNLQSALSQQAGEILVRIRLQQQLRHLALHDKLTGLANRDLFQYRLGAVLDSGEPLALFFIDLDGFKAVNDGYDHSAGDAVLREVARRITATADADDVIARFGGDEFVVLCSCPDAVAAELAESLGAALREPFDAAPDAVVSASIGVAVYAPGDGERVTSDELLSLADDAMYEAKGAGKNRAVLRTI